MFVLLVISIICEENQKRLTFFRIMKKKIIKLIEFLLYWVPKGDPEAYNKRKYRAEKKRGREYW